MPEISKLSSAELVAKYNALTGKSIKKFETRAIGEAHLRAELAKVPAAKIVENPTTKLLEPAPGVTGGDLSIEDRVAMAKRHVEIAPKLSKMIDRSAAEAYSRESAKRNGYFVAALGRGYLAVGETSWTHDLDGAIAFTQEDAARQALATAIKRGVAPDFAGVARMGEPLPKAPSAAEQRARANEKKAMKESARATTKAATPPKVARAAIPEGEVALVDICAKVRIEPRAARVILRANGERAPNGRWSWAPAEAAKVEALLKRSK